MIITNKYNLPKTFLNICERPTYTKGKAHISATGLLAAPRLARLKEIYDDKIVTDVSDMIWSIFGTAVHNILEQGKDENHIVEQRLHAELDGWHISGAIDLQITREDGIEINDYKTVGVWSVMNEKIEWEQQLNVYAWLVETVKKMPVTELKIIAIIRDWNRRDAQSRPGYPEAQVATIPVQIWPYEQRESFIRDRIHLHSEALFASETGEELPDCSPEDCWEKPTTYAIKKDGAMRAKSVHTSLSEAEVALEKSGKGYALEVREGDRIRCASFCPVAQFCTQYQTYLKEKS